MCWEGVHERHCMGQEGSAGCVRKLWQRLGRVERRCDEAWGGCVKDIVRVSKGTKGMHESMREARRELRKIHRGAQGNDSNSWG